MNFWSVKDFDWTKHALKLIAIRTVRNKCKCVVKERLVCVEILIKLFSFAYTRFDQFWIGKIHSCQ